MKFLSNLITSWHRKSLTWCNSYLEGEMVRSAGWCRVDLHSSSLHCVTDQDCLVDVSCENASLKWALHKQWAEEDGYNGTRCCLTGREGEEKTCRPKLLALQWWMPSSTELILITGKTGPKGSSHAILMSGRTWSSSNGHIRLPSLLYSWQKVAPFSFASITRPSMKLAEDSVTTGVISESSSGGPTFSFANLALTFCTTASAMDSMISTTLTAVHLWPLHWSHHIWVQAQVLEMG